MGPFPHHAPRAVISEGNPAGTDGFEFVEFAHPKPDEARARMNLPPVEGGDAVYLQQQNYSLAALAKRDAQPDPFGAAKPPAPPPALPTPDEPTDDAEDDVPDEVAADLIERGLARPVKTQAERAVGPGQVTHG